MSTPVITIESARELDALAQAINPVLFWTCNYEPTISYAISEDAKFLASIQDLYKFAIDANCVLKGIAFNSKNSICNNLLPAKDGKELRDLVRIVQTLRTVLDHNQSNLNGMLDSEEIKSYENWIRERIQKEAPASQDDFLKLNEALGDIGDSLIRLSKEVIIQIRHRDDATEIATKWIDATLRWYCTGARQDYYRGQLCDIYSAKASEHISNFNRKTDMHALRAKVNRWICRQTTHSFYSELWELRKERKNTEAGIENPPQMMLAIRDRHPDEYNKVMYSWQQRLTEIDAEETRIQEELDRFEEEYRHRKLDYFFDSTRLNKQFHETLSRLKEDKVPFTLLPQDFLYLDIEHNFKGVWSPDGDFK